MVRHVIDVVTFTEKTKHLFLVSKGIPPTNRDPYAVNEDVPAPSRRIPFTNMIYVGDGLTDVPCFSLIQRMGGAGKTFGVFDPRKKDPKTAIQKLIIPRRVETLNSPMFGPKDDLGAILRGAVQTICLSLDLKAQGPLS